MSVMVSAG